jgi:adenine-specific DNA methylase
MVKQSELAFKMKAKEPQKQDEFAKSCRPLEELLDSVRDIEGFPIGKDEDILALSDPPYYTACPNPYINDFIARYGKPYDAKTDKYKRTPFVADVSEGKNDPIYNAHSYHTKVPHKAIIPFIEHYTEPGDIVFDGFCGTGMTGVAAQMLGRRSILCDLSPAATFIAYNYNTPVDVEEFEREARRILAEVEDECGWMYETLHTDGKTKGKINYTVWSDVFICPYCGNEYVFWDVAVDKEAGNIKDSYSCPHCNADITKKESGRSTITFIDTAIQEKVIQVKEVPVLINYSVGKKRFEKIPQKEDQDIIEIIEKSVIPYWFPTDRIQRGDKTGEPLRIGITHMHQLYTKRNLWVLAKTLDSIRSSNNKLLYSWLTSSMIRTAKMYKFTLDRKMGTVAGTYYIPSLRTENKPLKLMTYKLKDYLKISLPQNNSSFVQTISSIGLDTIKANSIDYIFTDPPFGANLYYLALKAA